MGLEVPWTRGARAFSTVAWGKALMARAEDLARERGAARLLVTAGVGVRPYYRKLGYERLGPYMAKRLGG